MASRWEVPVLDQIIDHLDPLAACGQAVKSCGLDPRIFDARPESHTPPECLAIRDLYELLERAARDDGRLAAVTPLVRQWQLTGDIYSPKLGRFIEVDEYQHFSRVRLARIFENRSLPWRPLYAAHFWEVAMPRLQAKPFHDPDPPHRDEARAYRDELRERLPVLYGLRPTIRLDEFSLRVAGVGQTVQLIEEILETEGCDGHEPFNPGNRG
jgi:hypothetical protein